STPIPYCALQQLFDPFFRKGEHRQYWKAIYLDGLNDDSIDMIVRASATRPSSRSMVAVGALGGPFAPLASGVAPGGGRSAPFLLEVIGTWSDATDTDRNIGWVRQVFETMHRFSSGKTNLNFSGAGEDNEQFVRAAFGLHYPRLAAVKQAYDPTNLFRLNQNIATIAT